MTKTVYFGAGWFNDKQSEAYDKAMTAMSNNPTFDRDHSYVPLEHQYKDIRVDEHPEYLRDKEWSTATYNGDITGIKTSDIAVFVYLPSSEDVGCGFEMGYAKALGKYVLVVIPDDEFGDPINLMSWGGADNVIKLSDLETFDADRPVFDFYDGAVY